MSAALVKELRERTGLGLLECKKALAAAGIGEGMVRFSVGIEDPDDITDDLKQALRASQKG